MEYSENHFTLVLLAVGISLAIWVPVGLLLTKSDKWAARVLALANTIFCIPSLSMFAILVTIPMFGLGRKSALFALVLYAMMPLIRSVYDGVKNVDRNVIEPSSGVVKINGEDVTRTDPDRLRRGIGYVIQQIGLLPHRTIAENIAIVPRLYKWPKEKIKQRVDELIVMMGLDLEKTRGKYPSQLSGGQMQRVGVARAMAVDPPIMLMDEPFGAVDPIARTHLQDELLLLFLLLLSNTPSSRKGNEGRISD